MKPWRKVTGVYLYTRHKGRCHAMKITLECGHIAYESDNESKPYPIRRRCGDCPVEKHK